MTKVMCTGTFDILHKGHLDLFKQAKKHGNYLIVVIATDKNVQQEKGKPRHTAEERKQKVAELNIVDKVMIGNEEDKLKIVEQEKPDVIMLGYDQKIDDNQLKQELKKRKLNPKIIRAKAYQPEKYKSSLL